MFTNGLAADRIHHPSIPQDDDSDDTRDVTIHLCDAEKICDILLSASIPITSYSYKFQKNNKTQWIFRVTHSIWM